MSNVKLQRKGDQNVEKLSNLDHLTTNASPSQCEVPLYIFEDNEAVIKMIIKGRSPMMRYVSRTHRVALGWLLENQLGAQNPNQICGHQKPTRGHLTQRYFYT